jgi:hypothetical protein
LLWDHLKDIPTIQRALVHDDSSTTTRFAMSREALRLWRNAPLFGNGFDSFRVIAGFGTYAHDDYTEILCDLGVVGAMLFYSIHAYILFQSRRLSGVLRLSCRLLVLAMLVIDVSCVNYYMKTPVMLLLVLMAIVSRPLRIAQKREKPVRA